MSKILRNKLLAVLLILFVSSITNSAISSADNGAAGMGGTQPQPLRDSNVIQAWGDNGVFNDDGTLNGDKTREQFSANIQTQINETMEKAWGDIGVFNEDGTLNGDKTREQFRSNVQAQINEIMNKAMVK